MSSLKRSASWPTAVLDALWWLRPFFWTALAVVIWLAIVAPVQAQTFPWPPPGTGCPPNTSCIPGGFPGGNPGQCTPNPNGDPGCNGAGNPVDIITGNKYQHEVDLAPLPGELGLHFSRHYNSNSTHRGLTGIGWRSSYEIVLVDLGSALQIIDADGRRLTFDRHAQQPTLCVGARPEDGRVIVDDGKGKAEVATDARPSRTQRLTYRWQRLDGSEYTFSAGTGDGHPLQSIRAASGTTVTLTYLGGALDSVRDGQGRTLRFIYARPLAAGSMRHRMLALAAIDTPVGRISYKHDEHGRLQSVTQPNGLVRRYHYETERQGSSTNIWALTGISVESIQEGKASVQRLATYVYDAQGRAVRTQHVGGDDLTLAYGPRAATTITTSDGIRTVYRHALVAGQWKTVEAIGPGCASCPASNVRYRYRTDGPQAGQLDATLQIDAQGKPMQQQRVAVDARGRPTRLERILYLSGKAQPPKWLQRAQYVTVPPDPATEMSAAQYAALWRPRVIVRPSIVPEREHSVALTYNAYLQPLTVTEAGFTPPDDNGDSTPLSLTRTTSYRYAHVAGASRLTAVDGPLPGSTDTTKLHYDELGRLRLVQHPVPDLQDRFAYDEAGRIVWHTPVDAVAVRTAFDASGEPSTWQRGEARVAVERDGFGRPVRIQMPDGEVRWIGHDGPGGLGAVVSNRGWGHWQVPTLQAAQFLTQALSGAPTSAAVSGAVDSSMLPNVGARVPPSTWGPVTVKRDDFGRTVALRTQATGREVRHYDAADRLIERRFADGGLWRYERDAAGRVVAHTVAAPNAPTVTTRVHWFGAYPIRVEHPNETETRRFDTVGRMAERSIERASGVRLVERFGYDAADRLTSHDLPEGGQLRYAWGIGAQLRSIDYQTPLGQTQSLIQLPPRTGAAATRYAAAEPQSAAGNAVRTGNSSDSAAPRAGGGYRYGNGIEARWQLDTDGQLAALEHRVTAPAGGTQASWWSALLAWIPAAWASADTAPIAGWQYAYHASGRMATRSDAIIHVVNGFGYDSLGRLVISEPAAVSAPQATTRQTALGTPTASAATTNSSAAREYYAYDARGVTLGRRVNGADDDFRALGIERTASGLPQRIGNRTLTYSADRRLTEVAESGQLLASYRHNTYGERIGKVNPTVGTTDYLYLRQQLAGETVPDRPDLLARRYVYARGVPVAVIDYPQGQALRPAAGREAGYIARVADYAQALVHRAAGRGARIAYVHANEIGTPVAVTDSAQRVQWRAQYLVYGQAQVTTAALEDSQPIAFALNLRLPGQYWDSETGWHDNYLRTYDPARGQYLEPDPLGPTALGASSRTQPFSYANHNPLIYADPLGLILFAFDGTGNDRYSRTNVLLFAQNYTDQNDYDRALGIVGDRFYIEGVQTQGGTWDNAVTGGALAVQLRDRVDRQLAELDDYVRDYVQWGRQQAGGINSPLRINLDVVGFSRGAASAREFANMVVDRIESGHYRQLSQGCASIDLRMMALFDTVLSTAVSNWGSNRFRMVIPEQVRFVAHAVASNEYRSSFPLESIEPSFAAINAGGYSRSTRTERAFVGAHADIGGGYNGIGARAGDGGDLSDIALNWMVQQAQSAGVQMRLLPAELRQVTNPIVHNEQRTLLWTSLGERWTDREVRVRGIDRDDTTSMAWSEGRTVEFTGRMGHAASQKFIEPRSLGQLDFFNNQVGDVRMCAYAQWLNSNYGMNVACNP